MLIRGCLVLIKNYLIFGIGAACFIIYVPLCWVRKIEKFNASHIVADVLILVTLITIMIYAGLHVGEAGWGPNIKPINNKLFINMIGFAVFAYEGVGVVIPIMDITEDEEKYPKILFYCITSVLSLYIVFGLMCYFSYGSHLLISPIITSNLPNHDVFVDIVKVLYCINLVFSYPLVIYPANIIAEEYLFSKMKKSKKRMWLKNLYRAIMVLFTIVSALILDKKLDKFLSLIGAVACTPIAFTLPSIFHWKLVANTTR